ncbi:MAG: ribonuclease Z [Nitrososphaeria archaeon]
MKIVFLGTSAAVPTKERNTASIYITTTNGAYLFDAGEGLQKQLQIARLNPIKIKAVFISHIHFDHVLGLPGLLMTMALMNRKEPLTIVGTRKLFQFLKMFGEKFYMDLTFDVEFVEAHQGSVYENKEIKVTAFPTIHSTESYAYRIYEYKLKRKFYPEKALKLGIPRGPLWNKLQLGDSITLNGKKITPEMVSDPPPPPVSVSISGDTAYFDELIDFFKDSDVLIYESTFSKELVNKASEMLHSTSEQAALAALKSGIKLLVLYHFSERYKNAKLLEEEAKKIFPNTVAAKDFMCIKIEDNNISVIDNIEKCE